MSDSPVRPEFFEGQVLSAADLDALISYGRDQRARHERYLHTWGIAQGLQLEAEERETTAGEKYVDITVTAGIAVDGSGRQIVVPETQQLSPELFDQLNVAVSDESAWYPVLIQGRDQAKDSSAGITSSCARSQASRIEEVADLTFDRPGGADDLDRQTGSEVSDGPGPGAQPWQILLGFVQWSSTLKKLTALADSHAGISRRYAGVRADEVVARSGSLALRSADEEKKPAVILDDTSGTLSFGLQNSSGGVTPVFTVDSKGDVTAEGKIAAGIVTGVHIESGIASDGVLLPLPAGISEDQVSKGQVELHIQVTPRYHGQPPPLASGDWRMTPIECRVKGRRVLCRAEWHDGGTAHQLPGLCDYTVMAYVSA